MGRRIEYLRISVTERCDLRCAYCHPQPDARSVPRDVLTVEDVVTVASAALRLGVRRIRLTGGEPLLRRDLEEIISRLRGLPGLQDLALTTNGQKLARRAAGLSDAGLARVNISLDSLDAEVYAAATGGGDLAAVCRGIDAALSSGLAPVKLNVVLTSRAALERAGIPAFVELVQQRPVHVRFIEAMPTCSHVGYLPAGEVLDFLSREHGIIPVAGPDGGGPAHYYQLDGSRGTIGIIAPISDPFCARCNRLRVSARGELRPCLFSPGAFDLLPALRGPDAAEAVMSLLEEAAVAKPGRYGDVAEPSGVPTMHVIGG
ncbi:MAG: GTP 3',8-cyclase MoaA [Armatimonadota bacterium]|nr:MAG: GTP 3',8-cyclase MoaA [Armatimonadota bacterium]